MKHENVTTPNFFNWRIQATIYFLLSPSPCISFIVNRQGLAFRVKLMRPQSKEITSSNMEAYDELDRGVQDDGSLNLSHNTWKQIPGEVLSYGDKLLRLDLTNNMLTDVRGVENLVLLQALDVSFNQIQTLECMGRCIRLQDLDVSNNQLVDLPQELTQCRTLRILNAKNNRIERLPNNMADLFVLEILNLTNNQLKSLPLHLCTIPTLKKLDCDGNPDLNVAPSNMKRDETILFCLGLQQKLNDALLPRQSAQEELAAERTNLQHRLNEANRAISQLEKDCKDLEEERPATYIHWKKRFLTAAGQLWQRILMHSKRIQECFKGWIDRHKTHPLR